MEDYIAQARRERQMAEDWERVNPGRSATVGYSSIAADEIINEDESHRDEFRFDHAILETLVFWMMLIGIVAIMVSGIWGLL